MTRRLLVVGGVGIVLVRFLLALPGWYAADDLAFKLQAWTLPFWESVRTQHFGNLMPGGLAVDWIRIRLWPGYGSAAVLASLALAVSAVLLWVLLERMTVRPQGRIAGVVFFLLTPITAEAVFWWSAAMNFALFLPFVLVALIALVGYWSKPARFWIVVMVLAQAAALAFFQKAMLMPVWLVCFALLRKGGIRAARPVLLVSAGVSVTYVAIYMLAVQDESLRSGSVPRLDLLLQTWVATLGTQVIPAFAGGPWTFISWGGPSAVGFWIPGLLLGLVAAVLVAWALPGRLRWRAAAMILLWAAADIALVGLGRGGETARILQASDWSRYVADVSIPLSVTIALAASAVAVRSVVAAGLAVGVSACIGWLDVSRVWWANPGREWAQRAMESVDERPGLLLSQSVPEDVAPPVWGPAAQGQGYLAAEVPDDAWVEYSGDPTGLTTSAVVGTSFGDVIARTPGPICGGTAPRLVPLTARVPDGTRILRLRIRAEDDARFTIRLSEWVSQSVQVPVSAGTAQIYLAVRGAGDSLTASSSAQWCVQEAEVGLVVQ